jgi:hypothetical protein
MSPRTFYLAAIALLSLALILSFLTSISLPYLPGLDFVRVNFPDAPPSADIMSQLQVCRFLPQLMRGHLTNLFVLARNMVTILSPALQLAIFLRNMQGTLRI